MQLINKKTGIKGALAGATCALLGVQAAYAADTQTEKDSGWKIDTAFLSYSETDRVDANETNIRAQKTFSEDKKLNLNFVIDTLSGASPNGAAPSDGVQTFTSPSGNKEYEAPAGEIPLDTTFRDERIQIGASWEAPISRVTRYNIGSNISSEHDYQSISLSGGVSHDLNKKNTTLSLGGSYAADAINPEGDIPTPKSKMATLSRDSSSESKDVFDVVFGVTQVVNASTLMQFNVALSQSSGYLNDPFKIVSVVDANGRPMAGDDAYIHESRPDSRTKTSFYWDTKHHFSWDDTIDISYRFMTDDWGIDSHTVDLHYVWNITEKFYAEPHLRFYQQTAADFYRHSILFSDPIVTNQEEVSADYRLAEFDATTVGVKFGYKMANASELNLRLESYEQKGDTQPDDAVGVQKNYDMFPDMKAMIIQVGYSFKF